MWGRGGIGVSGMVDVSGRIGNWLSSNDWKVRTNKNKYKKWTQKQQTIE